MKLFMERVLSAYDKYNERTAWEYFFLFLGGNRVEVTSCLIVWYGINVKYDRNSLCEMLLRFDVIVPSLNFLVRYDKATYNGSTIDCCTYDSSYEK